MIKWCATFSVAIIILLKYTNTYVFDIPLKMNSMNCLKWLGLFVFQTVELDYKRAILTS
jgi:hypothetical protein